MYFPVNVKKITNVTFLIFNIALFDLLFFISKDFGRAFFLLNVKEKKWNVS